MRQVGRRIWKSGERESGNLNPMQEKEIQVLKLIVTRNNSTRIDSLSFAKLNTLKIGVYASR